MEMRTRKILVALCAIVSVGAALWIGSYPARYYFYLWRMNRTAHGALLLDLQDEINSISPYIVLLLVHTYENVDASEKSRHAAAIGLISADKDRAEPLFVSFLDNKDDEIVASAIFDLGVARSDKPFNKIVEFAHHPNKEIRWAVAHYLGHFHNAESKSLLIQMMANDPDETVRNTAAYGLGRLGVPPALRGLNRPE
jgi:HEAT repeat protein